MYFRRALEHWLTYKVIYKRQHSQVAFLSWAKETMVWNWTRTRVYHQSWKSTIQEISGIAHYSDFQNPHKPAVKLKRIHLLTPTSSIVSYIHRRCWSENSRKSTTSMLQHVCGQLKGILCSYAGREDLFWWNHTDFYWNEWSKFKSFNRIWNLAFQTWIKGFP